MARASAPSKRSSLHLSEELGACQPRSSESGRPMSMTFGALVRERRVALALSLEELSARVDVTNGTISKVENDQLQPSITSAVRLSLGLGLTLEDVVDALDGEHVEIPVAEDEDIVNRNDVLTADDVHAVVDRCRTDREAGRDTFLRLVTRLAQAAQHPDHTLEVAVPSIPPAMIDALLSPNPLYFVGIHYPPMLPASIILDTHRRGGAMLPADTVAYIQQVRPDLPHLGKKASDALQRIVTGQTERLRFADVLVLRDELGVRDEIVAMLWDATVLRVELRGLSVADAGPNEHAERLGNALITLGRWLQAVDEADSSWVQDVRSAE